MVSLAVHGHFYQPPRENPWTEEVAREPSAAPYHDWNARITHESYRPNAFARILDDRNRVVGIVNNYERLSFDVGPTLAAWLDRHAPEVLDRMRQADAITQGAMAQAFGHIILPLANARDTRTQIRWGLADFQHRFGRRAKGMWLPECAVNDDVLRILAEEGVEFTVLAPDQTDDEIDHRRPYLWQQDGYQLTIVFYDGGLSHAAAFELGTLTSEQLIERVADEEGLVVLAADGETFGHHHHWGDRLLAYALAVEAPHRDVTITNVESYLAEHPADADDVVTIKESAWSCAHGIGRWREDCGCSTGGEHGWNQRWREPLRRAFDVLRDAGIEIFERRSAAVLRDPWAARDAYVNVLIGAQSKDEFLSEHLVPGADAVVALTLLEAQHNAMAMYTSCGWFFNDLAGLETVQVLRYAARVIDLLQEIGEAPPVDEFLEVLAKAESNNHTFGDGRRIWRTFVEPARVDADRVVAHLALLELLEDQPLPERLAAWDVDVVDHAHASRGPVALCSGQVRVVHRRTGRTTERVYAALRLGGLEVMGATRPLDARRDSSSFAILRDAFAKGATVVTLLQMINDQFGPKEFALADALPDAADEILASTADALADRFAATCEQLFDDHHETIQAMAAFGQPLPPVLRQPAELALARRLEAAVTSQADSADIADYGPAIAFADQARAAGLHIETPRAVARIERLLLAAVIDAITAPTEETGRRAVALVRLAERLGLGLNVDEAQERLYYVTRQPHSPVLDEIADALGLGATEPAAT
jgi:alpha-amylase/alpha-mannosidase (GH57 family)